MRCLVLLLRQHLFTVTSHIIAESGTLIFTIGRMEEKTPSLWQPRVSASLGILYQNSGGEQRPQRQQHSTPRNDSVGQKTPYCCRAKKVPQQPHSEELLAVPHRPQKRRRLRCFLWVTAVSCRELRWHGEIRSLRWIWSPEVEGCALVPPLHPTSVPRQLKDKVGFFPSFSLCLVLPTETKHLATKVLAYLKEVKNNYQRCSFLVWFFFSIRLISRISG